MLTDREIQILLLISEGQTNREIADVMGYTPGTIRNMVSAILAKLHLSNRAELASRVARQRLELGFLLSDLARHAPLIRSSERGGTVV